MPESRRFKVEFIITDNDPCNDNRDLQAIVEVITREFGNTYSLSPITVLEDFEE
jgi:hypothetical protein